MREVDTTTDIAIDHRGVDIVLREIPVQATIEIFEGSRYLRNGDPGETGSCEITIHTHLTVSEVREYVTSYFEDELSEAPPGWLLTEAAEIRDKVEDALRDYVEQRC